MCISFFLYATGSCAKLSGNCVHQKKLKKLTLLTSALPCYKCDIRCYSFILFAIEWHCGKRKIHVLLSAGKVYNWLDSLFPDFPRDQIREAGEITGRIQLTLTYLGLMWENREREGDKKKKNSFLAACLPGALCLIALLLTKWWCNYKKEAPLFFIFSWESR